MKFFNTLAILGGALCVGIQASGPASEADKYPGGAVAWHNHTDIEAHERHNIKAHKIHTNETTHKGHEHHDGTQLHGHLGKRTGGVIDTIYPQDTGDMHYSVGLWKELNCKDKPFRTYKNLDFISSYCQTIPETAASFNLKGNVNGCTHFWYWDKECSDPAELTAIFGDISCYNGPGDPGHERIGSFKIACPNS